MTSGSETMPFLKEELSLRDASWSSAGSSDERQISRYLARIQRIRRPEWSSSTWSKVGFALGLLLGGTLVFALIKLAPQACDYTNSVASNHAGVLQSGHSQPTMGHSASASTTGGGGGEEGDPFHPGPEDVFLGDSELVLCGNSTKEAKALGCQYDILSNHWVPGACVDEDSVAEYQSDGSWFGYADKERTRRLTIDQMAELPYYWTSSRDHIVHCAVLWKKQFRAFAEQRPSLDMIIADRGHTMHCADFLMEMSDHGPDYRNIPIRVWVGYAGCWVKSE